MVRKIVAILLIIAILGMCGGCFHKNTGVRVVKQISVHWMEDGSDVVRVHRDPEKLHLILNKVRTLGQRFSTDVDPEALEVSAVTVTVAFSDGSQRFYQVKPDRFIRVGQNPWQQANPKRVTALRLLLLSLPGDL